MSIYIYIIYIYYIYIYNIIYNIYNIIYIHRYVFATECFPLVVHVIDSASWSCALTTQNVFHCSGAWHCGVVAGEMADE
jgi:hypothetical protein